MTLTVNIVDLSLEGLSVQAISCATLTGNHTQNRLLLLLLLVAQHAEELETRQQETCRKYEVNWEKLVCLIISIRQLFIFSGWPKRTSS